MIWKGSKESMSNWNDRLWTEELAYDITYHPPIMQYWVPSPDGLTTIYTWAHLALAAHMKAGWVNDPQVAFMTL